MELAKVGVFIDINDPESGEVKVSNIYTDWFRRTYGVGIGYVSFHYVHSLAVL